MLDIQSAPPRPALPATQPSVAPGPLPAPDGAPDRPSGLGLASRLLLLTISFALLAQVLIFVPRLAAVHDNWLRGRLAATNTAALVFAAAPDDALPKELAKKILDSVGAATIALKTHDTHRLLAVAEMPPSVNDSYDLRDPSMLQGVEGAVRALFAPKGAFLRVIGPAPMDDAFLEITLDETPLTAAMWRFTRNFVAIVMTISAVVVLVIWASIWLMVLRPVRRLTSNIVAFGERPQDAARIISPSGSRDEIGVAEQALATMQTALSQQLGEKRRLAELGLAVAKINHDLRNMLTAAQLISDRLATIPDPLAIRLGPRLMATLDRAITFCQETLVYGAASEKPPVRRRFGLREVIDQAIEVFARPADRPRFLCHRRARGLRDLRRPGASVASHRKPPSQRVAGAGPVRPQRRASGGDPLRRDARRRCGDDRGQRHRPGLSRPPRAAHLRTVSSVDPRGRGRPRPGDRRRARRPQRRLDRARAARARRFLLRRALSHHPPLPAATGGLSGRNEFASFFASRGPTGRA